VRSQSSVEGVRREGLVLGAVSVARSAVSLRCWVAGMSDVSRGSLRVSSSTGRHAFPDAAIVTVISLRSSLHGLARVAESIARRAAVAGRADDQSAGRARAGAARRRTLHFSRGSVVSLTCVFGSLSAGREGASKGVSNSGNLWLRTAAPQRSYPLDGAQWRSVTLHGSPERETYKQEVPGSSPGPPIREGAATRRLCRVSRADHRISPLSSS
jgi:hypothetical protein